MDQEAEQAIRDVMKGSGPHNVRTVPVRATKTLNDRLNGSSRVYKSIDDMVARGDLEAHKEPYKDWRLLR